MGPSQAFWPALVCRFIRGVYDPVGDSGRGLFPPVGPWRGRVASAIEPGEVGVAAGDDHHDSPAP